MMLPEWQWLDSAVIVSWLTRKPRRMAGAARSRLRVEGKRNPAFFPCRACAGD